MANKITLGTNFTALQTSSSLRKHTQDLSSVYQQLSSGMRINKACDDAAGLAISMNLAKEGKVQSRANLNISDGLSVSSIMEGALTQLIDITTRRMALAEQAANGVYSDAQRSALEDEFLALDKEFARILNSTTFNDQSLFYNDNGRLTIDAGYSQITLDLGDFGEFNFIQDGAELSPDSTNIGFSIMRYYGASSNCGMTAQVAVGDTNGDGKADIVATDYGTAAQCECEGGYSNDVYTYTSIGEGKAVSTGTTEVGTHSRPYYVELSDLNKDGTSDIMITAALQTADVYVSTNNGSGTFGSSTLVGDYKTITSMTVGDVNNDQKDDIIVVGRKNGSNQYGIFVQTGNGDGTFSDVPSSATVSNVGSGVFSVAAVNADGSENGSQEVIVYGSRSGSGGVLKTSNGQTLVSGQAIYDIATGDLNGDGKEDIAVAAGSSIRVFTSNGSSFTEAYSVDLGSTVSGVDIGDINGDGKLDIAAVQSGTNRIHTIFNSSDSETGTFGMTYGDSFRTGNGPTDVKLADVDGDGKADAVTANAQDGTIGIALAGKKSLRINTQAEAQFSLDKLNTTITDINKALAAIGAFESRLETAFNVSKASEESYAAANSRIMDIDVAEKSAELTRKNILQNISSSLLAQANQQPERALSLLENLKNVKIRN